MPCESFYDTLIGETKTMTEPWWGRGPDPGGRVRDRSIGIDRRRVLLRDGNPVGRAPK